MTRADAELRLVVANKGLLELVDIPTATDGTNQAIGLVLDDALRRMGYSVSLTGNPSDADLAFVPSRRIPLFYQLANLLLLEFILGTMNSLPDEWASVNKIEWGRAIDALERRIAREQKRLDPVLGTVPGNVASKPIWERPYPPDAIVEPWGGRS